MRSNAAAKTTRVEDRNSVPAQPMNQVAKTSRKIARSAAVGMRNETSSGGNDQTGIVGAAFDPYTAPQ